MLLRPLPWGNPEQIVFVWDEADGVSTTLSPARLLDLRKRATGLSGLAGFSEIPVNLLGGGTPERLLAATVSTDFFEVLGVKPYLGRTFDVGREHQRAVVLSHGLWERRFGGDRSIVGREIVLDSGSHTVAGVMPPDFSWLPRAGAGPKPELWVPAPVREVPALPTGTQVNRLAEQRDVSYIGAVARLAPGRGLREVNAGLAVLARELTAEHPDTDTHGLRAVPAMRQVAGDARTPLLLLLGAVGMVLAVACANVANLLLGRMLARRGEMAVRLALGAGRTRLARQFLVEALVLSGIAAGLGVLLAQATLTSLIALSPADVPRLGETRIDAAVLGFAILLALGTAVVLAVVPVMDVGRSPATLGEASRRTSGRHGRGRTVLLVGEVAAAVLLVIGAGLLIRTFVGLQRVNTGISRPEEVLSFNLLIGAERASAPGKLAPFYQDVLDRVRGLPQVRAAGAALTLPMSGDDFNTSVYLEGRPVPPKGRADRAGFQAITPGYFQALGLRLVEGRDVGLADGADAPKVVVVNETFARRFWGRESPLGRRLKFGPGAGAAMRTVVGVVQDVRHRGPAEPPRAELFLPVAQSPFPSMAFAVRVDGDPLSLAPAVRAAVAALDPAQPIADVQTLETYVRGSTAQARFLARLLAGFGGLALLLAAVGVYGVMSWSVVERRREIGVRVAVGATPLSIAALVAREGGLRLGIGLAIGSAAALGLGRLLSGVLFDVQAADPVTYLSTLVILALAGVCSLWLPAYRASRTNPVVVLRE